MKRVTCRSGINGWQARLHSIYSNYKEFCAFNSAYGIATRLGFSSAVIAWKANPVIQGSVNPEDLELSA